VLWAAGVLLCTGSTVHNHGDTWLPPWHVMSPNVGWIFLEIHIIHIITHRIAFQFGERAASRGTPAAVRQALVKGT
jgi:hypothetical protein